jgi:glucose-1-phosphate cytidylyltransferase
MKVIILAGGLGTRLSEETHLVPKPMVEIGGHPILWHIMKTYSYWGFNDFVILTGYKSHVIKEYFINYYTRYSDITVDMVNNNVEIHKNRTEPWKVTMLYTGPDTMTGGRLLWRMRPPAWRVLPLSAWTLSGDFRGSGGATGCGNWQKLSPCSRTISPATD